MYSTYGQHNASMIERFNRTIKEKMWIKFTEEDATEWIKFIDELGIVTNAVTPYMNAWLDQNRGLMGCDKTKPSSLTFFYDLNSNKSSLMWFPMPTFLAPKNFFLPVPKAELE